MKIGTYRPIIIVLHLTIQLLKSNFAVAGTCTGACVGAYKLQSHDAMEHWGAAAKLLSLKFHGWSGFERCFGVPRYPPASLLILLNFAKSPSNMKSAADVPRSPACCSSISLKVTWALIVFTDLLRALGPHGDLPSSTEHLGLMKK
jgi:hypothetical protein